MAEKLDVAILYEDKTWEYHKFEIADVDAEFLYEQCSKYEYKREETWWFEREYFDSKEDPRLKGACDFIIYSD